jgi:CPSF A subunit region
MFVLHVLCDSYLLYDIFLFFLKTEVDDVPLALLAFQGRLVAGVGKALRIYDIGKKKLLRKVENKVRLFRFK